MLAISVRSRSDLSRHKELSESYNTGSRNIRARGNEIAERAKDRQLGTGWRWVRLLLFFCFVAGKSFHSKASSHRAMRQR